MRFVPLMLLMACNVWNGVVDLTVSSSDGDRVFSWDTGKNVTIHSLSVRCANGKEDLKTGDLRWKINGDDITSPVIYGVVPAGTSEGTDPKEVDSYDNCRVYLCEDENNKKGEQHCAYQPFGTTGEADTDDSDAGDTDTD
jgi:hypothetical protein